MNFLGKIPILKEFEWFEKFEWFGPSPIEPESTLVPSADRNPGRHRGLRAALPGAVPDPVPPARPRGLAEGGPRRRAGPESRGVEGADKDTNE